MRHWRSISRRGNVQISRTRYRCGWNDLVEKSYYRWECWRVSWPRVRSDVTDWLATTEMKGCCSRVNRRDISELNCVVASRKPGWSFCQAVQPIELGCERSQWWRKYAGNYFVKVRWKREKYVGKKHMAPTKMLRTEWTNKSDVFRLST